MKALKYHGPYKVSVDEAEAPRLKAPTDAILRVTSAAICGSDLHRYDGRTDFEPGMTLGHEIMGVIDSVGDAVTQIKPGDRMILPFNIACGACRHSPRR